MLTPGTDKATLTQGDLIRVLGEPLRLRIVTLLAQAALCTNHLIKETGARQTALSNHLRVLREAGIVEPEPHGRFTYYRLRPEVPQALEEFFGGLARAAAESLAADRKRPCE
ncbi:metalloregulator ArsR/SmtB family transcription factor [Kitasatospora sp. NBC_00085]|uniref:ArsR/SmtB family transcription factor n=1 Tax=unclassified Kitasatospora TaxID=2633591 RepID=UPI002F90794D